MRTRALLLLVFLLPIFLHRKSSVLFIPLLDKWDQPRLLIENSIKENSNKNDQVRAPPYKYQRRGAVLTIRGAKLRGMPTAKKSQNCSYLFFKLKTCVDCSDFPAVNNPWPNLLIAPELVMSVTGPMLEPRMMLGHF